MPKKPQSEYAAAGVDYSKLQPFKRWMIEYAKTTLTFPVKRNVTIVQVPHAHGGLFYYDGGEQHSWCQTTEGLGNKNWIAEWMYMHAGTGRTYYEGIGIDNVMMAANDNIAQGALPVTYTDEVASGSSDWFTDEKRAKDLAESICEGCRLAGCALIAGESPAIKYLIKPEPPVVAAPSLSGCIVGIISPYKRIITGSDLAAGDRIIGVTSSGLHANGISLVIKRALSLPDKFLTKLPDGRTLGDHALIPTASYADLMETLSEHRVEIHSVLPGTGDGVGKLAYDHRPFTYRVHTWVKDVPPLFQFMRELGVTIEDCLKTFNWGIGYYLFVPPGEVENVLKLGRAAGYDLFEVGRVEEGDRCTIFEPEGITLPPPGE